MSIPNSTDTPYFIIDREIDHSSQARDSNIWQFKKQENIEKMIEVLLGQLQVIVSDTLTTQKGLSIEFGTGWLLDLAGKSLQVYRGTGQSDEDFKESIVQRILEDSSQGTMNDVLAVTTFFVQDLTYSSVVEATPATVVLQVPFDTLDLSQEPKERLKRVVSAGVGSEIHVSGDNANPIFSFNPSEGGFSATDSAENNGSLTAILADLSSEISPFRLDLQQGYASGLSATDALDQGQFVDLASYVDTTGDGIPDSPAVIRIEAKNYYPQ